MESGRLGERNRIGTRNSGSGSGSGFGTVGDVEAERVRVTVEGSLPVQLRGWARFDLFPKAVFLCASP